MLRRALPVFQWAGWFSVGRLTLNFFVNNLHWWFVRQLLGGACRWSEENSNCGKNHFGSMGCFERWFLKFFRHFLLPLTSNAFFFARCWVHREAFPKLHAQQPSGRQPLQHRQETGHPVQGGIRMENGESPQVEDHQGVRQLIHINSLWLWKRRQLLQAGNAAQQTAQNKSSNSVLVSSWRPLPTSRWWAQHVWS